jgi:MoaA/NifB/PqqE/SkfB family radical SAM enzyme
MSIIKLHGPRNDNEPNDITVQWSMGNFCNFECEYCPTQLHDGSMPWKTTEIYLDVIDKICTHYSTQNKTVNFELIGGEVTTIPGFIDILQKIKEHNGRSIVFTNGSRSRNWWSKAKHYIDDLIISFHINSMHEDDLIDMADEISDTVPASYHLAGVKDSLPDIEILQKRLREVYRDNKVQDYYGVNIDIKTMYKKLLGPGSKQEPFYNYDGNDWRIINLPAWEIDPSPPPPQEPIVYYPPEDNQSHFLFTVMADDKTVRYMEPDQIMNQGLNKFKGMTCHIGERGFNIDMRGNIVSSWCGAKIYGNVFKDNFELPTPDGVVCPHEHCNNPKDIAILKTA